MLFLAWAVTAVNIYFGLRFLLNAVHILHTSKYSKTSTIVFAILFLSMGAGSAWLLLTSAGTNFTLLLGAGPWALALVFLLINMMTGDHK